LRIAGFAITSDRVSADAATFRVQIPTILRFSRRRVSCRVVVVLSRADELAARLQRFAIETVKFARSLPRDPGMDRLAGQLVGAGTGASANYRAARRARSRAEFIAKLSVAAEEADEAEHWLGVIRESDVALSAPRRIELERLWVESRELRAILVQSVKTARANSNRIRSTDKRRARE
jgi:four helix bundle protein